MLTHHTIGPTGAGRYLVAYLTPGCGVPTVACDCGTVGQADAEAKRLNAKQQVREMEIQCDRAARGLAGAYQGLRGET
jgi:hypothetical protein